MDWDRDRADVALHDTDMPRVKATVGRESVMLFAEPLAQACAALRGDDSERSRTTQPLNCQIHWDFSINVARPRTVRWCPGEDWPDQRD